MLENSANLSPSAYLATTKAEILDINEINTELKSCLDEQKILREKIEQILKELE